MLSRLRKKEEKKSHISQWSFIARFSQHCLPTNCVDEMYGEYPAYQCLPTMPQQVSSSAGGDAAV